MINERMEFIRCPLCDDDNAKVLFRRPDLAHRVSDVAFPVVRCRSCTTVYVNPRPTKEEIQSYYPREFYEITDKESVLEQKRSQLQAKFELVKHMESGTLLDIGCGKGEFLYFMQRKGWRGKGVEFSSKPPNIFKQDIFYGELKNADYPDDSFNLVTMWALLEHVYDPLWTLKEVNRILAPSGRVVLLVTNFDSLPSRFMRHDDIPRHVTLFSKKTITKMLISAGFEIQHYVFSQDIFSGSVRGVMNYLVKLAFGEKLCAIVEQNRSKDRWFEFSSTIKGRESMLMRKVDSIDIKVTPYINKVLDYLGLGFIMIVEAKNRDM
jgi:ubiquinone/menaquinone biosynthesis C-methylase UbiE